MTESSWPFDNGDTSEAQFSALLNRAVDTGVLGGPSGGELAVYADGNGMFVRIPAGDAIVQGFYYRNDSLLTLSVPAAGSTARVDSVVLRLDTGANRIVAVVKTGDANPPALTQTAGSLWEMRLADYNVPASASSIAASAVTDRRSFSSSPWGRWSTDQRPQGAREGRAGYNVTTKAPEWWNGSSWQSFGGQQSTSASSLTSGTLATARLDYGVLAAYRNERAVDAPVNGDLINGDWNAVLQPGVYRTASGQSNANSPSGANLNGTLVLFGAGSQISSRTQAYFSADGGHWWRTAWSGNDWGGWRSASANVGTTTGAPTPVDGWAKGGNNQDSRAAKTGLSVTISFQFTAPSGTSSSGARVFKVPSGMEPANAADSIVRSSNANDFLGVAVDTDGYLRIRSGNITGGNSLYGTITYVAAS